MLSTLTLPDVQKLLRDVAPKWADEHIEPVMSSGTDNAMFRLGENAVLRIPKRASAIALLKKEIGCLGQLDSLPLAAPKVLADGDIRAELGSVFAIFDWQPGAPAIPSRIDNVLNAAHTLGVYLKTLQTVDTTDAPRAGAMNHNRGASINVLSEKVHQDIQTLADEVDGELACSIWSKACFAAPPEKQVWIHGDLKADNLIANDGSLSAVIDWGLSAVGDRAVDLAARWTWVDPNAAETFKSACEATDADWARAKGWALYAATVALAFYRGKSHAELCKISRQTLMRLGVAKTP